MWERPFFHEGMRDFQDRFDGRRVAEAIEAKRKHYEFWDDEKALIESSPFFFIATSWQDYADCSIRSGDPGFVRITGPNVIEFPEYDGNSMYRTIGNIAKNPNVGLLVRALRRQEQAHPRQRPGGHPGRCSLDRPAFRRKAGRARRM